MYVSGSGATQQPGRFTAVFARVKGETELAERLQADSVRPCLVDARDHDAIRAYIRIRYGREASMGPLAGVLKGLALVDAVPGVLPGADGNGEAAYRIQGDGAFRPGRSWVLQNWGMRMMGLF